MGILKEFKEFAVKGNVVDLAVGVIIGGAFGGIVTSLVNDIITPAILSPALKASPFGNLQDLVVPGTAIKYGSFLSQIINFTIVAFALFMVIKGINKMKKAPEPVAEAAPEPTTQEKLLMEIRDALKK